jgi:hypothetical protein
MVKLVRGMECPEELEKECRIVSAFGCKKCSLCGLQPYHICTHCAAILISRHRSEFEPMFIAERVSRSL